MAEVVGLIAGCYEQITFGYRVKPGENEWTVKADFTHHAHTASVSVVAASERFVVTGSKDETIQVYNMKQRTEHGALLQHEGSITCLEFHKSHLLSGGEDGLLCVWSTKTWECVKSIRAHKGHVTSLAVHPSGKLALTVGTDKTLRTWNLTNGRSAFIKNIKQNAHIVKWSPDGDHFVVAVNDNINIYKLESASVIGTITNPKRISSLKFLNNSILAVAGDDETVRLCNVQKAKWVCEFKAHETRVKAVESLSMGDYCMLATASNDGFIKMWKIHLKESNQELESPILLGEVNTTARLTCLAVWKPSSVPQVDEEPTSEATTSKEPSQQLMKRVRVAAEEVVLEDESKPKKKKKVGGKKIVKQ